MRWLASLLAAAACVALGTLAANRLTAREKALNAWEGALLRLEAVLAQGGGEVPALLRRAAGESVPLLLEAGRLEEISRFGQVAVKISPYEEILYAFQMRALIAAGNYAAAEEIHRNVYQLLSNDLGVTPSEDLQELHMEALRHMDETVISEDLLLQSLREQRDSSGAMVCDFSTFRLFYQAKVRSASRRGDAVHLGLFSVEGKNGAVLRKPVLSRAMDQLRQQLHQTLRSGDIVASCSASQYVALLVQANFEDSQMVCQRVIRAFEKAYPRSQAEIRSGVIPLETHLDRM